MKCKYLDKKNCCTHPKVKHWTILERKCLVRIYPNVKCLFKEEG